MLADPKIYTPKQVNSNMQECEYYSQSPHLKACFESGTSQPLGPQKCGTCYKLVMFDDCANQSCHVFKTFETISHNCGYIYTPGKIYAHYISSDIM
jgi:hypothetical protein